MYWGIAIISIKSKTNLFWHMINIPIYMWTFLLQICCHNWKPHSEDLYIFVQNCRINHPTQLEMGLFFFKYSIKDNVHMPDWYHLTNIVYRYLLLVYSMFTHFIVQWREYRGGILSLNQVWGISIERSSNLIWGK